MARQDPQHVAIQIKEMLAKAQPLFTGKCCIYRVPIEIRKLNQDAYTPKVISIGPFHHGNPKLLNMEGHKKVCCRKFIDRSEASLDKLVSCVQDLEPFASRCYLGSIELSAVELVEVILVDCGFIFEHFLRCCFDQGTDSDQYDISLHDWLVNDIELDLKLLENQLPFFVFERLYSLAFASSVDSGQYPSFLSLACYYFQIAEPVESEIAHFTDLLRTSYLQPFDKRPSRGENRLTHLGSVTELDEAGVKFRVNETTQCLLDLQISGRYLKIPPITVEDNTETLFRNIMALEHCRYYPNECYVTEYIAVLHFLINTHKDVDLLVKNGIIVNWIGDSTAVAELINGLGKNIVLGNFNTNYLHIEKKLNDYCKHPLYSKIATLRRDYCNTPWKMAASIAGITLLILSITQTVCSILQVVQ